MPHTYSQKRKWTKKFKRPRRRFFKRLRRRINTRRNLTIRARAELLPFFYEELKQTKKNIVKKRKRRKSFTKQIKKRKKNIGKRRFFTKFSRIKKNALSRTWVVRKRVPCKPSPGFKEGYYIREKRWSESSLKPWANMRRKKFINLLSYIKPLRKNGYKRKRKRRGIKRHSVYRLDMEAFAYREAEDHKHKLHAFYQAAKAKKRFIEHKNEQARLKIDFKRKSFKYKIIKKAQKMKKQERKLYLAINFKKAQDKYRYPRDKKFIFAWFEKGYRYRFPEKKWKAIKKFKYGRKTPFIYLAKRFPIWFANSVRYIQYRTLSRYLIRNLRILKFLLRYFKFYKYIMSKKRLLFFNLLITTLSSVLTLYPKVFLS